MIFIQIRGRKLCSLLSWGGGESSGLKAYLAENEDGTNLRKKAQRSIGRGGAAGDSAERYRAP